MSAGSFSNARRFASSQKPSHMWFVMAAVFLHLVELRGVDDGERVLLAVDDMGLQRRIDLVEVDARAARRRGLRTARSTAGSPARAVFMPFRSSGADDRLRARGDLAEAVVPDALHRDQPALARSRARTIRAERAVHGRPDLPVVLEREADAVDRGRRHQRRQDQPGQGEKLDRAGAKLASACRCRSRAGSTGRCGSRAARRSPARSGPRPPGRAGSAGASAACCWRTCS